MLYRLILLCFFALLWCNFVFSKNIIPSKTGICVITKKETVYPETPRPCMNNTGDCAIQPTSVHDTVIQICCDGYSQISKSPLLCLTKCQNCPIGGCPPEKCTCFEGYNMTHDGCVPHCTNECQNGLCVEPEKCECNDGYNIKSDYICTPDETFSTGDDDMISTTDSWPESSTLTETHRSPPSSSTYIQTSENSIDFASNLPEETTLTETASTADSSIMTDTSILPESSTTLTSETSSSSEISTTSASETSTSPESSTTVKSIDAPKTTSGNTNGNTWKYAVICPFVGVALFILAVTIRRRIIKRSIQWRDGASYRRLQLTDLADDHVQRSSTESAPTGISVEPTSSWVHL